MKRGTLYEWITPNTSTIAMRDNLKQVICEEFGCTLEEFMGRSRQRRMVDARSVFCLLCRRHTRDTLMRIAIEIGGRDHAAVINLIRRTERLIEGRDSIALVVERIEKQIFNNQ